MRRARCESVCFPCGRTFDITDRCFPVWQNPQRIRLRWTACAVYAPREGEYRDESAPGAPFGVVAVSGRRSCSGSDGCMHHILQRTGLGLDARRSRIAGDRRRLQEHDAADESVAVCCAQSLCLCYGWVPVQAKGSHTPTGAEHSAAALCGNTGTSVRGQLANVAQLFLQGDRTVPGSSHSGQGVSNTPAAPTTPTADAIDRFGSMRT